MDKVKSAQQIEHDDFNVHFLKLGPTVHHLGQIYLLVLKNKVQISESGVLLRWLNHIINFHHVRVARHRPQNLDFPQAALGVQHVAKNVVEFLDGHCFSGGQVRRLHDGAVAADAQLF